LNKNKIIPVIIIVLLLCAGIIALTQETDEPQPEARTEFSERNNENWNDLNNEHKQSLHEEHFYEKQTRWFRSNAGGMAIQEMNSRYAALRNEYALAIDIAHQDEIPEYILPFYNDNFTPEIRILFKNSGLLRTQWILKDNEARTRVNAVFFSKAKEKTEQLTEDTELSEINNEQEENFLEIASSYFKEGFVELYDEKYSLISEYKYFENGNKNKIDHEYNKNLVIVSTVMDWEEINKEYSVVYKDFYYYNRSLSLRTIERIFFKDMLINDDSVKITFPRRIMDALNIPFIEKQKLNIYPDFFGDIFVIAETKIIFENDDRGRAIKQTYYDENDDIIWTIENTWSNDRIVSTKKKEGDIELIAEYEYDSSGNRIAERNFKNGTLERVVYSNEKTDIEELYFNNILVLRAVWEDGRKISETRIR